MLLSSEKGASRLLLEHDLFRKPVPPRIKSGAGFFGIMIRLRARIETRLVATRAREPESRAGPPRSKWLGKCDCDWQRLLSVLHDRVLAPAHWRHHEPLAAASAAVNLIATAETQLLGQTDADLA